MSESWSRKKQDESAFLQMLARSGPPSSVFFVGPEAFLRDECLSGLRRAVLGEGEDAKWCKEVYQARDLPLSELTGSLRVVGLFAESRLIVVSDVERYGRAGQRDRSEFWGWLEDPTPGTTLALVTEKPLWEVERGNEFLKGTLGRCDAVVRLDEVSTDRAVRYVLAQAPRRFRIGIDEPVAARIVETVGPNLMEITNELERLSLRFGEGETVQEEDLDRWLRGGIAGSLNEMEAAVRRGDACGALRHWDAIKESQSPPAITWIWSSRMLDPRWGRGGGGGTFASALLRECYRLERGIKTGEVPSASQETAWEAMLVRLARLHEILRQRGTSFGR